MKHKFERYCKEYENIENYQKAKADNFKGWSCHHRLETHNSDGERRLVDISYKELKALGMYYNRPPEELIFLRKGEHSKLHNKGENHPMYGKHHSAESIQKISEAKKGEKNAFYGKHHSEESKKRISEAMKGNKYALGNTAAKGTHWYNNGKINIRAKECPPGFVPGRLRK